MTSEREHRLHATCVAIGGRGVLLRGPSGSGKSDLALRLIGQAVPFLPPAAATATQPLTAHLVADDQVLLRTRAGRVLVRPPGMLAGKLEVRGIGIVEVPHLHEIFLDLVVDLVPQCEIERMPPDRQDVMFLEILLPCLSLAPFEASAPLKVALALARLAPISNASTP